MQVIDRGLGWLWRVLITAGLIGGILMPPMLLKLINQLDRQQPTTTLLVGLTGVYFGIFLLLIGVATAVMRQYTGEYYQHALDKKDWGIVLLAYLLIIGFEAIFQTFNQLIYHQSQTQNNVAIKNLMSGSPLALWLMTLSAVLLTPIVEELIFRGVLTNLFFKQTWLKIGLSGLVFGSLHSNSTLPSFLIYVMMGLILASVYRLTGKIRASIMLHFIINALAMGIMLTELI